MAGFRGTTLALAWPRLRSALFGAFGGLLPEIVNLYQKRYADIDLSYFSTEQYIVLTAIYLGSAAIVASIFPYPRKSTAWRAVVVGMTLPTLIGTGSGVSKALRQEPVWTARGADAPTVTLIDLLAMF